MKIPAPIQPFDGRGVSQVRNDSLESIIDLLNSPECHPGSAICRGGFDWAFLNEPQAYKSDPRSRLPISAKYNRNQGFAGKPTKAPQA